jgi:hypothetical protein
MSKNYTAITEVATKITVTITRRQLWNNFLESWTDVAWNGYSGIELLGQVHDALVKNPELDILTLRRLFRNGDTFMLMGDAMSLLDVPRGTHLLREIVVTDGDKRYVVYHGDIVF